MTTRLLFFLVLSFSQVKSVKKLVMHEYYYRKHYQEYVDVFRKAVFNSSSNKG